MYALEDVDLFNIVCLPLDETSDARKQIYSDVLEYCYQRRAILIVDPPPSWSNRQTLISNPLTKLQNDVALTGEEARNAFLYYPRVEMPDPLQGGQIKSFPACGLIAGVIARTDANHGVWTAPAGQDASLGAVTLEVKLSDRENGILNPVAINCLRTFPLVGTVIWGSRTLRGADQLADEYKYLPVRRTALYIEESLYRGSTWIVFQPNAEPLWAQIRLNFGAFMNDLFRKGAFQGARPQDAYFVRCDSSTTTQNDIDRGVVNIIVGFAPLKPAEFVVIELQQIAGQIQV
jgi:phage tail sheath protein FI